VLWTTGAIVTGVVGNILVSTICASSTVVRSASHLPGKRQEGSGLYRSRKTLKWPVQMKVLAEDLEEMNGQYIWSLGWYEIIKRVQFPKPTRLSLSHLHYILRSPASTRASARIC
jgi:hypothetical protein